MLTEVKNRPEYGSLIEMARRYQVPATQMRDAYHSWNSGSLDNQPFEDFLRDRRPLWLVPPAERKRYIKISEFASLIKRRASTILTYIERGMPGVIPSNRSVGVPCYVDAEPASRWIETTKNKSSRGFWDESNISIHALSKEIGVTEKVVKGLIKSGLPFDIKNKSIPKNEAYSWLSVHAPYLVEKDNFVCGKNAAKMLGISINKLKWTLAKADTPPNGIVKHHISGRTIAFHKASLIEWVRDNTDIKIPASAWPKTHKTTRVQRNTGDDNRPSA